MLSSATVTANEIPPSLTEAEATAIVEAQINAKNEIERERRKRILADDSDSERIIMRGSQKTLLRRVGFKHLEKPKHNISSNMQDGDALFTDQLEDYEFVNISLSATVYDDSYTQITWRDENGIPTVVWSNVNFKYLRPISSYQIGNVQYSYFGLTSEIDTSTFFIHPETGEKVYPHKLPDWMPTEDDFPNEPSYLVLAEENVATPEALYEQIDALIIYYTEEEEILKAAYQRSETLRKAKSDFLKSNPQPEKDIVINYWPIKSNSDL
ncbi:MAG: hypothetical protein CML13_10360 [Puniceicoccaceae bacterium]|nr:hypothetical protein [Puniceicoccaceae bacterium]|tara:strand:+ start:184 stop:987 length:804 start_codon:yes stop_codon:yes gene_type:complete